VEISVISAKHTVFLIHKLQVQTKTQPRNHKQSLNDPVITELSKSSKIFYSEISSSERKPVVSIHVNDDNVREYTHGSRHLLEFSGMNWEKLEKLNSCAFGMTCPPHPSTFAQWHQCLPATCTVYCTTLHLGGCIVQDNPHSMSS